MRLMKIPTEKVCPNCEPSHKLVRIKSVFDAFPDEPDSREEQETEGCSNCGWQYCSTFNHAYDPYSQDHRDHPRRFAKEDFIIS